MASPVHLLPLPTSLEEMSYWTLKCSIWPLWRNCAVLKLLENLELLELLGLCSIETIATVRIIWTFGIVQQKLLELLELFPLLGLCSIKTNQIIGRGTFGLNIRTVGTFGILYTIAIIGNCGICWYRNYWNN